MNYDNIPQRIKDTGQFCTWKYEQRKERMTKVPYNPVTGQKASVDRPETFVDFKTAIKVANAYSGIGIHVTGQIIAIDLDHCIEDNPPYGYVKDLQDKLHWIVDEEVADVVREIFHLCMQGFGPPQIAKELTKRKILCPTAHFKDIGLNPGYVPANPCAWQSRTVADILSKQEYLGHTVNFKSHKKSYKSKKTIKNDPSEWQIF